MLRKYKQLYLHNKTINLKDYLDITDTLGLIYSNPVIIDYFSKTHQIDIISAGDFFNILENKKLNIRWQIIDLCVWDDTPTVLLKSYGYKKRLIVPFVLREGYAGIKKIDNHKPIEEYNQKITKKIINKLTYLDRF